MRFKHKLVLIRYGWLDTKIRNTCICFSVNNRTHSINTIRRESAILGNENIGSWETKLTTVLLAFNDLTTEIIPKSMSSPIPLE